MIQYSVLRFSPHPEYVEPVNVGIILRGRRPRLLWDESFPKLRCAAPGYDHDVLNFWLEGLASTLDSNEAVDRIPMQSPQLSLGPTGAVVDASSASTDALKRHLLHKPGSLVGGSSARATREHMRSLLDELVIDRLGFAEKRLQLMKKAKGSQFLPRGVSIPADVKAFDRVLRGQRRTIVFQAADLLVKHRDTLDRKVMEIAYGYRELGRIQSRAGDIVRASIVFNAEAAQQEPRLDFELSTLRNASDIVVDASNNQDIDDLRRNVAEALPAELPF